MSAWLSSWRGAATPIVVATLAGALVAMNACSVLTDFGDLTGAATASDASLDAPPVDSSASIPDASSDASADADATPAGYFFDDFNRADNANIGNGWIMKNTGAFTLTSDAVEVLSGSAEFQNSLVYRPASEDILNVAIQADVRLAGADGGVACEQIHARIQEDTVAKAGDVDDYLFFLGCSNDSAVLFRVNSGSITNIGSTSISPPVASGQNVRLALSVTGTNPVIVVGTVSNIDADGAATVLATTSATDSTPKRIMTAGSVGFSANYDPTGAYTYDNFVRMAQ